jgi:hypothetical protein
MGSPGLAVEVLFSSGRKPSADDAIADSSFDMNDEEEPGLTRESDGGEPFGMDRIVEIGGIGICKRGRGFLERDVMFRKIHGGLVVVPLEVTVDDRGHL